MATNVATAGFRWIELLEKEFDKSFVGLEEWLRSVADDYDLPFEPQRQQLANMASCFVQVVHKSQAVFQANAKAEAELIHLREELASARASATKADAEKQYAVGRLQAALLENHRMRGGKSGERNPGDEGHGDAATDGVVADIERKLTRELSTIRRVDLEARKCEERCSLLESENSDLRRLQVDLESELVGARLDARYLDKELAGRIQQIQILLAGGGTSQEHKQRVWNQIEAEMHLQRSKTIASMCYSKQRVRDANKPGGNGGTREDKTIKANTNSRTSLDDSHEDAHERKGSKTKTRQVYILKNDAEELGMAIIGGSEFNLPVIISEIFPNTPVGRCAKVAAGDVIVSVNGDSFIEMGHHEAVKYLSSLRGTIRFDLESHFDAENDDVCDLSNRYYALLDGCDRDKAPPSLRMLLNHPGRAQEARKESSSNASCDSSRDELPEVHSSPAKKSDVANGSSFPPKTPVK